MKSSRKLAALTAVLIALAFTAVSCSVERKEIIYGNVRIFDAETGTIIDAPKVGQTLRARYMLSGDGDVKYVWKLVGSGKEIGHEETLKVRLKYYNSRISLYVYKDGYNGVIVSDPMKPVQRDPDMTSIPKDAIDLTVTPTLNGEPIDDDAPIVNGVLLMAALSPNYTDDEGIDDDLNDFIDENNVVYIWWRSDSADGKDGLKQLDSETPTTYKVNRSDRNGYIQVWALSKNYDNVLKSEWIGPIEVTKAD